ncbi:MAG: Ig-like domain-containing protein, partial [Campylobacteraceae bacterium]|nr:Ig-like domain-containing protein [Campylobacteraceae bacterium]
MSKSFFVLIAAIFLTSSANAVTWSEDLLYLCAGSGIYSVNPATGSVSGQLANDGGNDPTCGLGPIDPQNGNYALRMYTWGWTWDGGGSSSYRIRYMNSGATDWTYLNYSTYSALGDSAGGEVDLNGNVYIMVQNSPSYPITSQYLIIFNPRTGAVINYSGSIGAASTADQLTTNGDSVSDMAIDAEGNAYMLIRGVTTRGYGSGSFIVRIVPGTAGSQWKYNIVKKLSVSLPNIYGMAFLNGYLYTVGGTGASDGLLRIDPLSGSVTKVINSLGSAVVYDMASAQTAPVITGKIYNDANGNGVIDTGEGGIGGITVEIYDSATGAYLGVATTNGNGDYTFLVKTSATGISYHIRVKNPIIDGLHAAQTYASAGNTASDPVNGRVNTVTAFCADFDARTDAVAKTINGTCYGARLNGIDSSTSTNILSNQINYLSTVVMRTDKAVAHADFGFTAVSDRGDAPQTNYGEAIHNIGVKDFSGKPIIYLGSDVSAEATSKYSADADADDFDDGMFALINGVETPLQNAVFLRGKDYTFRSYVNGIISDKGCIRHFIGLDVSGNGGFINTFQAIDNNNSNVCYSIGSESVKDKIYRIPSTTGTLTGQTFFRTRLISMYDSAVTSLVTPTGNTLSGPNAPWVLNGEVEDYKILVVGSQIRLNVKSIGDVGNFTFGISNVDTAFPSINTRTLRTTASNVFINQPYDGTVHAISTAGADIKITPTVASNFGLVKSQTGCVDLTYSSSDNLSITFDNSGAITVPAAEVKTDSDIACNIVYGVEPTIEFITNIANRAFTDDNFNISVKDASDTILKSNQTTSGVSSVSTGIFQVAAESEYLFDQVMASGSISGSNHYTRDINCTNLKDNSAIVANALPFTLNATFGDNIKCEITNDAIVANLGTSEIKAVPSTQTVGGNSTITVTLKDSSGDVINSGGDRVVIFMDATAAMRLTNGTASYLSMMANITAIDNGNGTYDAYIGSDLSGVADLTFSVNGIMGSNTANVTFKSGNSSGENSRIDITHPDDPTTSIRVDNQYPYT